MRIIAALIFLPIFLFSFTGFAQQQLTDRQLSGLLSGKSASFSDGIVAEYQRDGRYKLTTPSGAAESGKWKAAGNRVCIEFANGKNRCDTIYSDSAGHYLVSPAGTQFRIYVASLGTPPVAATSTLNECEQTLKYSLHPLAPDVPANARAFSGVWAGKWDMGMCGALVVEHASANGFAQVIYAWGSFALEGTWAKADYARFTAQVTQNKLTIPGDISFDFVMRSPTQLSATRRSSSAFSSATFTKRQ